QPARPAYLGGLPGDARLGRDSRPTVAEKSEQVLLRLPVGVVLVNAGYDIQLINGAARRLLEIHGTAIDQDFVHVASRLPSQALRSGIDHAFKGESSSVTLPIEDAGGRGQRVLRLSFDAHRVDQNGGGIDSAIVMIEDTSAAADAVAELEGRVSAT